MTPNIIKCAKGSVVCLLLLFTVWTLLEINEVHLWNHIPIDHSNRLHVRGIETATKDANITVVTAYFDLGSFRKGSGSNIFTRSMYYKWAGTFGNLRNPLVIYTDSESFKQHMLVVRRNYIENTKVFVINRSSSWAFRNVDKIKDIFTSKGYPKHYPNTVISEYACAQHAKSDVLARAAEENLFRTKYFMWLDVGFFRAMINSKQSFYLKKPNGFDEDKIAMNRVYYNHELSAVPKSIFRQNLAYVGGGVMFGERQQIIKFSSQVKKAVDYFLTQGVMNTDQQVIYAMFSDEGRQVIKPEVELQYYTAPTDLNWFYLGKSMVQKT